MCVFLEPIALYHERDLHEPGDGGWLAPYGRRAVGHRARPAGPRPGCTAAGENLTIVTFGNGVRMSLRVAARLRPRAPGVRVMDLRWLAPLPAEDILREATMTGRVLVADETRRSGGVSEAVVAALVDGGFTGAGGPGDQPGQLHPAGRRGGHRAAVRAGHRDRRAGAAQLA